MENAAKVRAVFQGLNVKTGKTVMQFELDPEHKGALPQLAMMTGTFVTLELTSDQMVIPVDPSTGEVAEGQDEMFTFDGPAELPPAAWEYDECEDDQDEAA